MTAEAVADNAPTYSLSPLECAVLQQVACGKANHQVAEALGLSPFTVKSYMARIAEKLYTGDRTEMVIIALRARLIDGPRLDEFPRSSIVRLTETPQQILRLVSKGYSNKQIAGKLYLGLESVKIHIQAIAKDLGLPCNRTLLAAVAFRDRLL